MSDMGKLRLGRPYPLGAMLTEEGVNFSLFSANATGVELCLFNGPEGEAGETIRIRNRTNQIWHIFVPGIKAGQRYGYRVEGPYEPENGQRFNRNKVLLDPYSKAISAPAKWDDALFGYQVGHADQDRSFDERDSAPFVPKSVVIDERFDWGDDERPAQPMESTVIYEAHVKGFSKLCPHLPEELRGTYQGLGSPEAIKYFRDLGITTIELLPVQHRLNSRHLIDKDLGDYWGYNTIGFFAPDGRFSSRRLLGDQVTEFKTMVKNLHAAGLEVILDVVYNHTPEGSELGPTVCFRGIDNATYYRLRHDNLRYYQDYTGTGNTLAVYLPNVLQLVMDSLRYWVTEMHVDGFRFDLAPALARELSEVNSLSSFFDVIHQDPVLSQVKLIAEPWDIGEGGYQVGKFPINWSEWNDKYRDAVRKFWKGDAGLVSELASRLSGSADLYAGSGKTPSASINFITAHDGFTLQDLVTYQDPRNHANGEDNRDGHKANHNWNCGVEGPTDDAQVNALRRRMKRNLMATLFLSQGVPMICGGDECNRTQQGNNNAYCQDNETSWMSWNWDDDAKTFFEFTKKLTAFMKKHASLRRFRFFKGRPIRGEKVFDVMWLNSSGKKMSDGEWNGHDTRCLGVFLSGDLMDALGNEIKDDYLMLCLNAHHEPVTFKLPQGAKNAVWERVMDTASEEGFLSLPTQHREELQLEARSLTCLRLTNPSDVNFEGLYEEAPAS